MKSFAILGLGRFGRQLALQLSRQGAEVLAIDRERKAVESVADEVTRAVTANFRDEDILDELGVVNCDTVILAVGSDLALAVMTVMNLKHLGAKYLICKAYDEMYCEVLLRLGADRVIIPESEIADKLAFQLTNQHLRDFLKLSDKAAIEECRIPQPWQDKTIAELKIRNQYHVNIIAIRRGTETIINLTADTQFQAGDTVIMIGLLPDLQHVLKLI